MKKAIVGSWLALLFACGPAEAQFLAPVQTMDLTQSAHAVAQLAKDAQLVIAAKQTLTQIPAAFFHATDMSGYLNASATALAQAQALCRSVPAQCAARGDVAAAQTASLQGILASLQSIRNAAQGAVGPTAAGQAQAAATVHQAAATTLILQRNAAIDAEQAGANAEGFGVPQR